VLDDSPKSRAGRRAVSIPSEIIPELRVHLEMFAEPGEYGRVFTGPNGGPLKHSGFRRTWHQTRTAVGLPNLHFHDLRHIGNTLAASSGASLKELMSRMGHSSTRAALIYQHASQDRDKAIARALGQAFKKARANGHEKPSGTQRARKIIKFQ
jgi:integrase